MSASEPPSPAGPWQIDTAAPLLPTQRPVWTSASILCSPVLLKSTECSVFPTSSAGIARSLVVSHLPRSGCRSPRACANHRGVRLSTATISAIPPDGKNVSASPRRNLCVQELQRLMRKGEDYLLAFRRQCNFNFVEALCSSLRTSKRARRPRSTPIPPRGRTKCRYRCRLIFPRTCSDRFPRPPFARWKKRSRM